MRVPVQSYNVREPIGSAWGVRVKAQEVSRSQVSAEFDHVSISSFPSAAVSSAKDVAALKATYQAGRYQPDLKQVSSRLLDWHMNK